MADISKALKWNLIEQFVYIGLAYFALRVPKYVFFISFLDCSELSELLGISYK